MANDHTLHLMGKDFEMLFVPHNFDDLLVLVAFHEHS